MLFRTEPLRYGTAALLTAVLLLGGFCAGQARSETAWGTELPEYGFLTAQKYHNNFYRLSLDLPESTNRTRLRTRIMQRGGHALLAMTFRNGKALTEIAISSYDSSSARALDPADAAKRVVVRAARQHVAFDARPQRLKLRNGIPVYYVEFYKYAEKQITCHIFFQLRGDLLHVSAISALGRESFRSWLIGALHFDDIEATADVEQYFGPTIPDAVVERAISDKPGLSLLADSRITGSIFVDKVAALRYRIPAGWRVLEPSAAEPLQRFEVLAEEVAVSTRQRLLFLACSRTLLNATATKTSLRQSVADPGLRLIALDPGCIHLSMLTGTDDERAESRRLLLEYPDFGEVRSSEFITIAGERFLVVRSLLPDVDRVDGLRSRITQNAYVVERNGLLLIWFFSARIESSLPSLDETNLSFESAK